MPARRHTPLGPGPRRGGGSPGGRPNSINVGPERLDALLDRFESANRARPGASGRVHARWPFRAVALPVTISHPGGTTASLELACRNLSASGIGLVHSSFVHPGSRCTVELPEPEGRGGSEARGGVVVRCQHLQGLLHEVGVRFDRPLNLRRYVRPSLLDRCFTYERVDPAALRGRLVCLDASPVDQRIMRHLVRDTSLRLTVADTWAPLLERRLGAPDVVICEAGLWVQGGVTLADRMLEVGMAAPVLLVSAGGPLPTPLGGVEAVLAKPIDHETLLRALGEYLLPDSRARQPGPAADSLAGLELRRLYIERLRHHARDLQAHLAADRGVELFGTCVQLRATAPALGFDRIAAVATRIAERLSEGLALGPVRAEVEELTALCLRAGSSDASAA